MRTVSISELKAHLSRYVREVRRGGEIQVLHRGVPVARLGGLRPAGPDDDHLLRLVSAGVVRPAESGSRNALELPPLELPVTLGDALRDDRADRL
ncbi:MAG TPA: type II toxin-antitoxin system Phd/YefM family antitoxin [Acidimicrobiia bacterium]|jgi:prevent-host-death family protein